MRKVSSTPLSAYIVTKIKEKIGYIKEGQVKYGKKKTGMKRSDIADAIAKVRSKN